MITTIFTALMCTCVGLTISNTTTNENYTVNNEISNYCNAQATNEGMEDPLSELYIVSDLNDNEFYIQTGEERGFMVFDPVVSNFIEKSASYTNPYDFQ